MWTITGATMGVLLLVALRLVLRPIASALTRAGMSKVEGSIAATVAADPNGQRTARYPAQVRAIGWVLMAVYTGGAGYYLTAVKPADFVPMATIVGLAWLLVLYIVIDFQGSRITWDDRAIVSIAAWREPRRIEWRDIAGSHFDEEKGTLVIESVTGTKIRLPKLMSGVSTLKWELRARERKRDVADR